MITDSAVVHVRMGQLAIGQSPTVLKTTLGSCVGIVLLWRERAVYALAHCLLPYAPQSDCEPGVRNDDLAVISMLRMLKAEDRHHTQIEAYCRRSKYESPAATVHTPLTGRWC
jgi:chemotaxis protein CheD